MHGHFFSEKWNGRRVALQKYKPRDIPGIGSGVRLWNQVAVGEGTRLLAFKVIKTLYGKEEFHKYCARRRSFTWAIQNGIKYHVYNHKSSKVHLVNQHAKGNVRISFPRTTKADPEIKVVYLKASCKIKAGSPLSLRYNSKSINKIIKVEQAAAVQEMNARSRRCEEDPIHRNLQKARAVAQGNKNRKREHAAHMRSFLQ